MKGKEWILRGLEIELQDARLAQDEVGEERECMVKGVVAAQAPLRAMHELAPRRVLVLSAPASSTP